MPSLALFSSVNRGLCSWDQVGSLTREVAIYKKFVESGWHVAFYTYDRTSRLPDIGFAAYVYPQWPYVIPRQLNFLYHSLLPFRFFREGRKADIIMTNQAHSSGPAPFASSLWDTKIVARCGYVYGEAAETLGYSGRKARKKICREQYTFARSDLCAVPTKELKNWICNHYHVPDSKVVVLPNYVDTTLFTPDKAAKTEFDIIFVGRLSPTKRPHLLLEALAGTRISIHMIGDGDMKGSLMHLSRKNQNHIQFTPRVVNDTLPRSMNSSKIYINLSRWEGHPKSMIEAMACGRPCIGVRSPGINNLVIDGETGILVDPEPRKIREAVENLLFDPELRNRLGKNAREYALKHFSLDVIFPKYKEAFEQLLQHPATL